MNALFCQRYSGRESPYNDAFSNGLRVVKLELVQTQRRWGELSSGQARLLSNCGEIWREQRGAAGRYTGSDWPIRGQCCDQSEARNHRGHLTRGQGSLAGDIRLLSGVFTFHSLYMLPVIWCWLRVITGVSFLSFPSFLFPPVPVQAESW